MTELQQHLTERMRNIWRQLDESAQEELLTEFYFDLSDAKKDEFLCDTDNM